MPDLNEALKVAITAAKKAGKIALKHYKTELRIELKHNSIRNVVTNADKEADAAIRGIISGKFPEHTIVTEENAEKKGNDYIWYVDPIDGTTNYSHGMDYFCVSIALAKGSEFLAGVVFKPATNELYTATKGKGAFLNGKSINASGVKSLSEAMICTDFPYDNQRRETTLAILKELMEEAKSIRIKGSGALEMCETASGINEGYFHIGSHSWDYAASTLILREAGGVVTDLLGNEWNPESNGGIIAGNSRAMAKVMLERIKKTTAE